MIGDSENMVRQSLVILPIVELDRLVMELLINNWQTV